MIASSIADTLNKSDNIAIVSHIMPDGDSIGSSLALYNVLKRLGKKVHVISSDLIPDIYNFLPGIESLSYCSGESHNYDVLVVLDCGSMDRTGKCSSITGSILINIDHHLTNTLSADLKLVDTDASSTGELIFNIIKLMGMDIGKDEALCLYTSILTDTGCFKYSNTTPLTHQIAGDLIKTGIDFGYVHDYIYRNFDYNSLKLLGKALCNLELFEDGKISILSLTQDDLKSFDMSQISTSDFIDYGRDIKSVVASAFLKELSSGEFRVSFRSKDSTDVRTICEKFGGGGHAKAAGCTINGDYKYVKDTILRELINAIKDDNA